MSVLVKMIKKQTQTKEAPHLHLRRPPKVRIQWALSRTKEILFHQLLPILCKRLKSLLPVFQSATIGNVSTLRLLYLKGLCLYLHCLYARFCLLAASAFLLAKSDCHTISSFLELRLAIFFTGPSNLLRFLGRGHNDGTSANSCHFV